MLQMNKMPELELLERSVISVKMHGDAPEVTYADQNWQVVNSKLNWVNSTHSRWVSLGSTKERERLFFDENSDPVLVIKHKAEHACRGKDISETLTLVNTLINELTAIEGISDRGVERSLDAKLAQFLIQKRTMLHPDAHIDVHFDELVEKKILVCRHKGLLAASILAHLVEKGLLPEGCVRQYRSSLKVNGNYIGAHTWAVYRDSTTGDLWMCDPRWRTAKNVTKEFEDLAQKYGDPTLSDMIKRLEIEDRLFLIEEVVAHEEAKEDKEEKKEEIKVVSLPPTPVEKKPSPSNFDLWKQGKGSYRLGYGLKYMLGYGAQETQPKEQPKEKSDYDKWVEGDKQSYRFGYYTYWAIKAANGSGPTVSEPQITTTNNKILVK
ncbi:MAG: hypothetical protein BGO43_05060 [Gammaproteobacteria bacterium 39-13]|nr:hypothetical protein [Gammaproteobacteria bacterium]OJV96220.1 MAG: hypothetical protein BGO43_05060 [Gammaproteobacteria bacterium 39-13]